MYGNKNQGRTNRLVQIILVVVILISAYKLGEGWIMGYQAKQVYEELQKQVMLEAEEVANRVLEPAKVAEPKLYPPLEIDLEYLKERNGDFRGWLYYPVLGVNYPVVQAEDNDYYLRRSFDGESLTAGCIFMDCEASADFSDRNTFIFGHNMRDGSMFGGFRDMASDTTICQENPYFYIYTEEAVYTYEIFSYYIVKEDSDRYMTFTKDDTYDVYVEWALENSIYQKEIDLSERNNIVTLSTCSGRSGSGKRLLVHGVLIRTEAY